MPPSERSEQERIDAAVAEAVESAEKRLKVSIKLDQIASQLKGIVDSQKGQLEVEKKTAVSIGQIDTRLDGVDARLKSHSEKIDEIDKGPGRRGLVSGGAAGVGGAAGLYGIIEIIKAIAG